MPWWAWVLLDVFLVLLSLGVLGAVLWSLWGRVRRFLRVLGEVRDQFPQGERPR